MHANAARLASKVAFAPYLQMQVDELAFLRTDLGFRV
jgi:hypothetical protein